METYGIDIWGENNFIIENGLVKVNHASKPALINLVKEIREQDYKGPLLLRFPHLTQLQIDKLFNLYENAIKEYNYQGKFNAVFPLKVNQLPNFLHPLIESGKNTIMD